MTCSEPGSDTEFVVDYDKLAIATGSQVRGLQANFWLCVPQPARITLCNFVHQELALLLTMRKARSCSLTLKRRMNGVMHIHA